MKCFKCGNEMRLDDVDSDFSGNRDNFYLCDNCFCSCYEQIRSNSQFKVQFFDIEGVEINEKEDK